MEFVLQGARASVCTRALNHGVEAAPSTSGTRTSRLFLESASLNECKKWLPTGIFHGIATNPLLLKESNVQCQIKSLNIFTKEALRLGAKEVHLVAWGKNVEALVRTGSDLSNIDDSVVVLVPATYAGFRSAKKLKDTGARVGLAVYSLQQALLALGTGVEYAAFNVGKVYFKPEESKGDLISLERIYQAHGTTPKMMFCNVQSAEELMSLALGRGVSRVLASVTPSAAEQLSAAAAGDEMADNFGAAASSNSFGLFL